MKEQWKFLALRFVSNTLILGGVVFLGLNLWPLLSSEAAYQYRQLRGINYRLPGSGGEKIKSSPFAALIGQPTPVRVTPYNREFTVVIEKIGVNAPIVADVDVTDERAYKAAMRAGVVHAKGTVKPGEAGNSFLFAHSSLDFWQLGPHATVFNLLRKLKVGDRVVVFREDRQYNFKVVGKEIVHGFDTTPLLRQYGEPTLTLQTCDPPGTTLNRLIVTARLTSP